MTASETLTAANVDFSSGGKFWAMISYNTDPVANPYYESQTLSGATTCTLGGSSTISIGVRAQNEIRFTV